MIAERMTADAADDFYARVPLFDRFDRVLDPALSLPVPDDWVLGVTDVVASTRAIAEGHYKSVNMAGAAAIAAVANALGRRAFPFAFGGDGATCVVPGGDAARVAQALAATVVYVREELGLELRAAMLPVRALRAGGADVRLARFSASPNVDYAMFSGGGAARAVAEMKAGHHLLPPAPAGSRPDLSGLSCRWDEVPARRGLILSVLAEPVPGGDAAAYAAMVADVLALAGEVEAGGRPLPPEGPVVIFTPTEDMLDLQQSTRRPGLARLVAILRFFVQSVTLTALRGTGLVLGGLDVRRYLAELTANADFRKYEDGLKLTLDCSPALADRIEARLDAAFRAGAAAVGVHRQETALITCFTPSMRQANHVHFIDGAGGGYAAAARALKGGRRPEVAA